MRDPAHVTLPFEKPFHSSPEYIPNPLPGTWASYSLSARIFPGLSLQLFGLLAGGTSTSLLIRGLLPGSPPQCHRQSQPDLYFHSEAF